MLSLHPAARFAAAALALACLGCQGPVKTQSHRSAGAPLLRIAVAPLQVSGHLGSRVARDEAGVAADIVAHQLAEALARRGVQVVAPSDVARAFAQAGAPEGGAPAPQAAARLLAGEFGADAVLLGVLTRWEKRAGTGAGALHAAAVGFEVLLHSAPGGERLWSGNFDHRQKPLGENLLVASRYPGGGTRWLSAPELARWGAGEVAQRIPLH